MPTSELREELKKIMDPLATEFQAVPFEPHVTLHVASLGDSQAMERLDAVATRMGPVTVNVTGVGHSPEFTKTLFLRLERSAALLRLRQTLIEGLGRSRYSFAPHLSLLYAPLAPETRRRLSAIRSPFSRLTFDALAAVSAPPRTVSHDDVRAWRVLHSRKLTGAA